MGDTANGAGVTVRHAATSGIVEIADIGAATIAPMLSLPVPGRAARQGTLTILWVGPRRWHAVTDGAADLPLIETLRARCPAGTALVDLSDGRVRTRLSGPAIRIALATGCTLDLRAEAFGPDDCAATLLGKIPVVIHAREGEVLDLYCDRSLVRSLTSWLTRVAVEHGSCLLSQ